MAPAALWLLLLGLAPHAQAVTISYDVQFGNDNGFRFSFIHGASANCCGAPAEYFNSGPKLFRLAGSFDADWNAGTLRATLLSDQTLDAVVRSDTVPNASIGDTFRLDLLAGSYLEEAPNGRAQGELHYELYDNDDLVTPVATGTFYVFAEPSFPILSQQVSASEFSAWANNWDNSSGPVPSGGFYAALGVDIVSMPEPTPAALALLTAAAIGALQRIRRR